MTKYWVEIRPTVRRQGSPNLVPLEDIGNYTGFRSCFAFPPETVEVIRAQGNTGYLRGLPVYCDVVLMDFDNFDPVDFRQTLKELGLAYEEYDSGNRSVHIHIPCLPMKGVWVPSAVKQWVQQHAPRADISFLHPAGMYRLPGTFHSKNPGKMKELVHTQPGRCLELTQPPEEIMELTVTGTDEAVIIAATKHCAEGHRRPHAWRIASCAAEAGWEYERALDAVVQWNDNFCNPPHHVQDLESQVSKAYRRHNRRYG